MSSRRAAAKARFVILESAKPIAPFCYGKSVCGKEIVKELDFN